MMMLGNHNGMGSILDTVGDYITGKATTGAEAAIPEIKAQIEQIVAPVIILTGASLVISLLAYREARRARKPSLSGRR